MYNGSATASTYPPPKLPEAREIPFRLVRTHRGIRFCDPDEYKSRDDLKRRRAADEMPQLTQELGLYELR